jgi:hypothetical protein
MGARAGFWIDGEGRGGEVSEVVCLDGSVVGVRFLSAGGFRD